MDGNKSGSAFLTIGELSSQLGLPQHILRYWETRFPQLRPLTRAGNRRYYRPDDVALATRIDRLLNKEGYTVRGVQKLLASQSSETEPVVESAGEGNVIPALRAIRDSLARALAADDVAARL